MNSSAPPLFAQSCQEVLTRLEGDGSHVADLFRTEARDLLKTIDSWASAPPEGAVRSETISRVLDLYQRTLDYLANKS